MNNKTTFRPIYGTEEAIKNASHNDGFVYFSTDTKKIFVDFEGQDKVPLGGSSGVFYGQHQLTEEEKFGDDKQVTFLFSEIENYPEQTPNVDDLILNIPDGGFYRVMIVYDDRIVGLRLAISGGGSGGGTETGAGTVEINYITPSNLSMLSGEQTEIKGTITVKDNAGDLVYGTATLTWNFNGKSKIETFEITESNNTFSTIFNSNELNSDGTPNKVVLVVTMNAGGQADAFASKTWRITVVQLSLSWDFDYNIDNYIKDETFMLRWRPGGGHDCITHIEFYDSNNRLVHTYSKNILAAETGQDVTSEPIDSFSYGVYTCRMWVSAIINGTEYKTPVIANELTFISGEGGTLLTVPFYTQTATQYDTLSIPFMVYEPNSDKHIVSFYVGDDINPIASEEYDGKLHYWNYSLSTSGTTKLTIKSGNATKIINLTVTELNIGVKEVSGYAFSLKAKDLSTNGQLQNWTQNGVNLEFSNNFWKSGSGLDFEVKTDGSIEKYIKVKQGTTLTINYNLFENFNKNLGKDIKICFKATNCYKYDAPVLSCLEQGGVGLIMDAQSANFKSSIQEINTQYFENSYIEFETEIWPNKITNNLVTGLEQADRYIMLWLDGVPAAVRLYAEDEKFQQNVSRKIVIGSEYCDVYIYLFKVYEKQLSIEEHMNNFIVDAPSPTLMKERFDRNDIMVNGQISYEELIKKNPKCHAYLYEIPRMTTSKNDKVKDCIFNELFDKNNSLDNPYYKADGVQTYVQGTSSAAYGVAAFNIRSKFPEKTWTVSNTAIPINLACTKVNVASCENANNVVNQEWYNRFQPYWDGHRRATREDGKIYRDTMEFNSGVVFIKDKNTNFNFKGTDGLPDRGEYLKANVFLDVEGYQTNNFPYRQYAIGNMGNDKKNTEVFHSKNSYCVEVLDNQNNYHFMTKPIRGEVVLGTTGQTADVTTAEGRKKFWTELEVEGVGQYTPPYEFRYPEGEEEVTDAHRTAFMDFVNWMADNNPKAATGDLLFDNGEIKNPIYTEEYINKYGVTINQEKGTIQYPSKIFQGFNPPGYDDDTSSGISLKGFEVSQYANTYTHDTYEYRMAKMLAECEEHLVMDSVVYHYLFIQRHTMVDNVAKNTFWSTEDGIHWDLTKDYDNDTADGNNNSGYLVFNYGIECLDKDEDNNEIFNAPDSVWINFIHGLPSAQKELYTKLEKDGAWDAQAYLTEFKKHQDVIPERCWIEDYFRKYIRPYRLGLDDDTYLKRLEGGKKTHQRTQYENYQEFYINSKYRAGTQFTQSGGIDLRINKIDGMSDTDWEKVKFSQTSYIDCYPSGLFGGQIYQSSTRIKRGEPCDIKIGEIIDTSNDGTCYIYGSRMVQKLSGLAELHPSYISVSAAPKLQTLELGNETMAQNTRFDELHLENSTMLQNVYLQRLGTTTATEEGAAGPIKLTNSIRLNELQLTDSTFTSLTIAPGAPVKKLSLNNYLTQINVQDLELIEELKWTENDGILNKLKDVTIKNCPAFDNLSYQLATKGTITNYLLTNFNWEINNINELEKSSNGTIIGIAALNELMKENVKPNEGLTTQKALMGSININCECTIDDYGLYEKYRTIFPNITITYGNNVALTNRAVDLIFYSDENENVFYTAKGQVSAEASQKYVGNYISTLPKISDTSNLEYDYIFTGCWRLKGEQEETYYYLNINDVIEEYKNKNIVPFSELLVSQNTMEFIAVVNEIRHQYILRFHTENEYTEVVENTFYGVPVSDFIPSSIPYKDDSDLPLKSTYDFKGYSISNSPDATVISSDYTITGDQDFYAIFKEETDITNIIHYDWFKYEKFEDGWVVSPADNTHLQGKITIPAQDEDKQGYVLAIKNFSYFDTSEAELLTNTSNGSGINVTHVFFPKDSKVKEVMNYCFGSKTQPNKLQYFDFLGAPLQVIGKEAFAVRGTVDGASKQVAFMGNQENEVSSGNYNILTLPEGLTDIYPNAFQGLRPTTIDTVNLPASLKRVGDYGFAFVRLKKDSVLNIGSAGNLSQLDFTNGYSNSFRFQQNSDNRLKEVNFYTTNYTTENQILQYFVSLTNNEKEDPETYKGYRPNFSIGK